MFYSRIVLQTKLNNSFFDLNDNIDKNTCYSVPIATLRPPEPKINRKKLETKIKFVLLKINGNSVLVQRLTL